MHFEKDVLENRIHSKHKMKEEAVEELDESKKGGGIREALEKKGYVSKKLASESKKGLAKHRALEAKKK